MLTLTDLFCGAGGSSTGAVAAPGVEAGFTRDQANDGARQAALLILAEVAR